MTNIIKCIRLKLRGTYEQTNKRADKQTGKQTNKQTNTLTDQAYKQTGDINQRIIRQRVTQP